jgi:hypothetical protein
MSKFTVYLTVHFRAEVEAESLAQAEELGNCMDYDAMESYDEGDFRVEPVDEEEEHDCN